MQDQDITRSAFSGIASGCGLAGGCAASMLASCFAILLFCLLCFGMLLNSCERAMLPPVKPTATMDAGSPLLVPRSSVVQ